MARLLIVLILLSLVGCSGPSPSKPATSSVELAGQQGLTQTVCHSLHGAPRKRAAALLETSYVYDCCDKTLTRCLQQRPRCRLAVRLANNICRRVSEGQNDDRIKLALSLRARMMQSEYTDERADIDLAEVPMVGKADAPITVVEYAGPRGEHCARLTPRIHRAIVEGRLVGKVKLYLKPFALRSNPHSKEAGVAFLAAQELGGFWDFVLYSYARFGSFTVSGLTDWADAIGLDRTRFEQLTKDPALVRRLVAIKKEGLGNGVTSTPTFFVNGRMYQGELAIEELLDVLEEAHDRSRGLTHEP